MASKPIVIVPHNLVDHDGDEDDEIPHPYTSRPISEVQPKKANEEEYDTVYSWIVCGASFLTNVLVFGVILNFNVYFGPMLAEFSPLGYGPPEIAWIASLSYGFVFLIGPLATFTIARLGTRYAMLISCLLVTTGFLASKFATDVFVLYISYGILMGSGMGTAFLCSFAVLNDYFKKYLRLATIIVSIGGGVGMVVFTPFFEACINNYLGWRDSMLFNTAISLHLIPLALIMRPRPRDLSVRVPGFKEIMGTHVLKSSKFQLFLAHVSSWNLGLPIVFIVTVEFMEKMRELSNYEALQVMLIMGVSNTLGRILSVPVERYFSPLRMYVVTTICIGIFEMMIPAAYSQAGFIVIMSALGMSFGIMICYLVPVIGELVGYENLTPALGYSNFLQGVGGLIGPPVLSKILDAGPSFIVGGAIVIISGFLIGYVVWKHQRDISSSSRNSHPMDPGLYDQRNGFAKSDEVFIG